MNSPKRVKDLMLPLSDYAVVPSTSTIREALQQLELSQKNLPEGRQPHRAVLVQDDDGRIVGKIGHLAFIEALLPEARTWRDDELLARAGVSDDMLAASELNLSLLSAGEFDPRRRAQHVGVDEVCAPATSCIDEEASLTDAMTTFVKRRTLSLLVCRCGTTEQTVGILRLSDLFDELQRQITEETTDPRTGT